jgi:4-amino-4-deoxychorismate lyase
MCRLFETIRVFDKRLWNIPFHNFRFNKSRKDLFGIQEQLDLAEVINFPESLGNGLFKCRVVYDKEIISVDFEPYTRRSTRSLKLVNCDEAEYSYKFCNRLLFDELLRISQPCDEILIVKNGYITDTSFSNVALYDGSDWVTPQIPLLNGTMRASLIEKNLLKQAPLGVGDIMNFKKISLINAMNNLGDIEVPVEAI